MWKVACCWLYYAYIGAMHGPMHVKFNLTSLQFTSLHITPHFSLPCTFGRIVTTLQKPFSSPHLQLLSKNMWFSRQSRQCLCRQLVPQCDCPICEGVFTDVYSLLHVTCPAPQNFSTSSHERQGFREKKGFWTQNVCFELIYNFRLQNFSF